MNNADIKRFVETHIPLMDSPEQVYELFRGLGYKTLDTSFKGKEAWGLREKDKEFVKEIYTIANYQKRFQIFLVELKSYSTSTIRNLPIYFERETQYPFFVITSDYQNYTFILVEKIREDVGIWKRKLVKLVLDREDAHYTEKLILSETHLKDGVQDSQKIYNQLTQAFSVEKVTKSFFSDYIGRDGIFRKLRGYLFKQTKDIKWSHDFSLQLLNRIMFLCFVQKKRWLDNNPRFLNDFWHSYKKHTKGKDTFYDKWLSTLFFEAFNNKFFTKPYFTKDINAALALAPYLNGGLFIPNKLDERIFQVGDELFDEIFGFFNKYNFTIREELPLEIEVAVDPEMIGKVYESMFNIPEETDERGKAGIFYTARTEIDLMCRRSLVEYFHNHLVGANDYSPLLYKFIFSKTDEEKRKVDEKISRYKLWEQIERLLDNLTVVDPACGSGSFLVGMLNILSDLYSRTYANLNLEMSDFDIKKSIIGRSLYGVDLMDWAVHVAELRLWLQLIVETELRPEQLKIQPLLPNLSFKIRQGDSLVQEIGGINLAIRTETSDISTPLKRRLTNLKNEKLKFFNNDPSRKFKSESMLLQEELNTFRYILDERILNLSNRKKTCLKIIEQTQMPLFQKKTVGAIHELPFKEKFAKGKYTGNKWGGKYLRAPDIFFTILEKGKGKLVRLGDIAEVRFGIKTGCNEFFYLDKEGIGKWSIEEEFLKPVIKSPRECKSILVKPEDLKYKVFMCHKDKKELKGTHALKYIEWGEKQGFHKRPSCRGRLRWWDLGENNAPIIIRSTFNEKFNFYFNPERFLLDKVMYGIFTKSDLKVISLLLNATLTMLFIEIYGTYGLGEGALFVTVYNFDNIGIISPNIIAEQQFRLLSGISGKLFIREILDIYTELGINPKQPIRTQKPNPLPDRKALDDIVFDILGLTEDERNEVYWAVCELVKNRLDKARSV